MMVLILRFHQILVETGFAPEWVELQKEIRIQIEALRKELAKCRCFKTLHACMLTILL